MYSVNGKNPYKYKSLDSFLKAHPKQKGSNQAISEKNWYDWEVENLTKSKKTSEKITAKKPDKLSKKETAKRIRDWEKRMKEMYTRTEIDRDSDDFRTTKGKEVKNDGKL